MLLGKHGTAASREKYNRIIGEWMAGGRQLRCDNASDLTVTELVKLFWDHVKVYYHKPDGTPSPSRSSSGSCLGAMVRCARSTAAASFGPLALKAVRQE
jgi:hypothetical protein